MCTRPEEARAVACGRDMKEPQCLGVVIRRLHRLQRIVPVGVRLRAEAVVGDLSARFQAGLERADRVAEEALPVLIQDLVGEHAGLRCDTHYARIVVLCRNDSGDMRAMAAIVNGSLSLLTKSQPSR